MATATRITFTNHKEVRKAIADLSSYLQDKARKDIAIAGGQVVLTEAKSQVPVGPTGNLKKSLFLTKSRRRVGPQAYVGASGPHAKLVEYGTKGPRVATKKARKTSIGGSWKSFFGGRWHTLTEVAAMPANPFMRRSIDKTGIGQQAAMETELGKVIERHIK